MSPKFTQFRLYHTRLKTLETQVVNDLTLIVNDFKLRDFKLILKERLGLKLTHKWITTKVVSPVSRIRVLYRGNV